MTVDRASSVQDDFFARARRDGGHVTIYLTNGKKLTGRLKAFDKFTLVLESNRVDQLIFKHAVSTLSWGRGPATGSDPERRARDEADRDVDAGPGDDDR
jgi:host factor-I protein